MKTSDNAKKLTGMNKQLRIENHVFAFKSVAFLFGGNNTPGNVCAVQWRLLSTVEAVQYSGGLA